MRKFFVLAAAAAFAAVAGQAFAGGGSGLTLDVACARTDVSPAASSCAGWFDGNLDQGSPTSDTAAALNQLLGVTTFTAGNVTVLKDLQNLTGNTVDFGVPMYGETVVSFHVGAAKGAPDGVGFNSTAFFEFDAGELKGGLQSIDFERAGLSNAELYSTGTYQPPSVPEPATWAMLILGVGMIGFAARRRGRGAAVAA